MDGSSFPGLYFKMESSVLRNWLWPLSHYNQIRLIYECMQVEKLGLCDMQLKEELFDQVSNLLITIGCRSRRLLHVHLDFDCILSHECLYSVAEKVIMLG